MRWEAICEQLARAGYVEFIEDTGSEPYLTSCLNSLECRGPTFLHFFGRDLDFKLIARCAACNMARDLSIAASPLAAPA